jgi:protein-S-isoprenylcysteine O-methyltransferase Ste14
MKLTLWQWDVVPWYVFGIYWLISALWAKRTKVSEDPNKRIVHVALVVLAFYLLFSRGPATGPLTVRFVPQSGIIKQVGVALSFLGVGFAIWARYCIGRYWSSRVTLKEDHQLIQSGPYAYVRHPIYTGMLIAAAGTALVVGEWHCVIGVVIALTGFSRKAANEEALLASEFGDQYREYRERTGFLTPRLTKVYERK